MTEETVETLREFLRTGPVRTYRLTGITETESSRFLGFIGISRWFFQFHCRHGFWFSSGLRPEARFRVLRVNEQASETDRLFVLFRRFDVTPDTPEAEDLIAGWVPLADAEIAQTWIDDMNQYVERMRQKEQDRRRRVAAGTPWLLVRVDPTTHEDHPLSVHGTSEDAVMAARQCVASGRGADTPDALFLIDAEGSRQPVP